MFLNPRNRWGSCDREWQMRRARRGAAHQQCHPGAREARGLIDLKLVVTTFTLSPPDIRLPSPRAPRFRNRLMAGLASAGQALTGHHRDTKLAAAGVTVQLSRLASAAVPLLRHPDPPCLQLPSNSWRPPSTPRTPHAWRWPAPTSPKPRATCSARPRPGGSDTSEAAADQCVQVHHRRPGSPVGRLRTVISRWGLPCSSDSE
jgi:hypothetical protein